MSEARTVETGRCGVCDREDVEIVATATTTASTMSGQELARSDGVEICEACFQAMLTEAIEEGAEMELVVDADDEADDDE